MTTGASMLSGTLSNTTGHSDFGEKHANMLLMSASDSSSSLTSLHKFEFECPELFKVFLGVSPLLLSSSESVVTLTSCVPPGKADKMSFSLSSPSFSKSSS